MWLDSIRVREICGAQSFRGMPGNPAPEPRSATRQNESTTEDAEDRGEGESTTEDSEDTEESDLTTEDSEGCGLSSWLEAKRDSPKWRRTISSGSRMAVRLMRAFQRRSISM